MTESEPMATCTDCGAQRPRAPGPCPECGSRNRTIGVGRATEEDSAGSVGVEKGVPVGMATEKSEALPVGFVKTIRNQAGQFMTERPRRRWVAAALTVGGVGLGFFALGLWGAVGAAVLAGLGWLVQETVYT